MKNQKNKTEIKTILKPLHSFEDLPIETENLRVVCKKKSGCYAAINKKTNDCYIGSAMSGTKKKPFLQTRYTLLYRYRDHFVHKKRTNRNLKKSIEKYGIENFSFHILKFTWGCPLKSEQKFLNLINPTYNICKRAGSTLGYRHTTKAKKAISQNRAPSYKRFNIGLYNRGKKMSARQKYLISQTMKSRFKNPLFSKLHRKNSIKSTGRRVLVTDIKTKKLLYDLPSVSLLYEQKHIKENITYKHLLHCALYSKEMPTLGIRVRYADVPYTEPKKPMFPRRVGIFKKNEDKPFETYKSLPELIKHLDGRISYDYARERARKEAYIPSLGFTIKFLPHD